MRGLFYFDFIFQETDTTGLYGFIFECKDMESRFESDAFYEKMNEMEDEFGVHDFSSYPDDGIYSIGFVTYEVERVNVLKLMIKWRDYFVSTVGEGKVGQITDLNPIYDTYVDDADIYNYIEEMTGRSGPVEIN